MMWSMVPVYVTKLNITMIQRLVNADHVIMHVFHVMEDSVTSVTTMRTLMQQIRLVIAKIALLTSKTIVFPIFQSVHNTAEFLSKRYAVSNVRLDTTKIATEYVPAQQDTMRTTSITHPNSSA
jgi:hypothetical protein